MSLGGTSSYGTAPGDAPDLVARAVAEAVTLGFQFCVHPASADCSAYWREASQLAV